MAGGIVVIRIHADEAGAIRLDVNDNGIGMRPGDVAIALQPFGQINRGDGRVSEGTGLGLPLTKRLVELHGGTLAIGAALGIGTMVSVRSPANRTVRGTGASEANRLHAGTIPA